MNLEKCFASFIVGACIEIQIRLNIECSPIVLSPFLLPAGVLCLINFQLFGPKNYCHRRMQLFINYRLRAKKPTLWKGCTKRHLIVNSKPVKKSIGAIPIFKFLSFKFVLLLNRICSNECRNEMEPRGSILFLQIQAVK